MSLVIPVIIFTLFLDHLRTSNPDIPPEFERIQGRLQVKSVIFLNNSQLCELCYHDWDEQATNCKRNSGLTVSTDVGNIFTLRCAGSDHRTLFQILPGKHVYDIEQLRHERFDSFDRSKLVRVASSPHL